MTEISEVLTTDQPAVEVWAALADFGAIVRWAPNVDHSCLMSGQTEGAGRVRRIQAGRNTLVERVVEWEPQRRLAYIIDGLPPVIRSVRNTWDLDEGNGTTTVTLTSNVDAGPRPPQKLVAKAVGRMLAKASRQMLGGLDDHLRKVAP